MTNVQDGPEVVEYVACAVHGGVHKVPQVMGGQHFQGGEGFGGAAHQQEGDGYVVVTLVIVERGVEVENVDYQFQKFLLCLRSLAHGEGRGKVGVAPVHVKFHLCN